MEDRYSTVRSRQLGVRLRELMAEHHWGVREMARRLDWPPTRISNMFNARRGSKYIDVVKMLTLMGVIGDEAAEIYALCDDLDEPGFLETYPNLPVQVQTLVWHEERATAISTYQGSIVPGLLQTADYARAVMVGNGAVGGDDAIDERVFARMSRQVILTKRSAPTFKVYLHEFVLRLPVGGTDKRVMSGQLHHLLQMSMRPNITIRVVPVAIGAHPATAGQFQLIDSEAFAPVAYIDSEVASLFLEKPEEIRVYRQALHRLGQVALGEAESRELVAMLATDLYSPGARQDVPRLA
ncbi:helix-turn-helix transcriptional regulator [Amycolatopsis carbonis]|uniref:Helix-turn-helix transcriptional regulator n=1 Tax=Amycolatopsis carbonis TaxID=715471 RepID=A0A9Y2IML8_9PSEU|nr:helix-turn-helix transcriptional regulator [Amycolatopsis sp. 2-15]WIX81801.1 helix-turn-helix transcriptional regulator [Amycolatopsis sp. 2-15]